MSNRKPLKVALKPDGDVWLSDGRCYLRLGEWDKSTAYNSPDRYWAKLTMFTNTIYAGTSRGMIEKIIERLPAIAEFVSRWCEK